MDQVAARQLQAADERRAAVVEPAAPPAEFRAPRRTESYTNVAAPAADAPRRPTHSHTNSASNASNGGAAEVDLIDFLNSKSVSASQVCSKQLI